MTDKEKVLDELGSAVREGEGFEVEENLSDGDLEEASGGAECLCRCAADKIGGDPTCGGGGGGGALEPQLQ